MQGRAAPEEARLRSHIQGLVLAMISPGLGQEETLCGVECPQRIQSSAQVFMRGHWHFMSAGLEV